MELPDLQAESLEGNCKTKASAGTAVPWTVLRKGRTMVGDGVPHPQLRTGLFFKQRQSGWDDVSFPMEKNTLYLWCVGFGGPVVKLLLQVLASLFCLQQLLLKLQKLLPGHHRTGLLLEQLQIPVRRRAMRHSGPQGLHLRDKDKAWSVEGLLPRKVPSREH